jgi:hypothetical protein
MKMYEFLLIFFKMVLTKLVLIGFGTQKGTHQTLVKCMNLRKNSGKVAKT